MGLLHIYLHQGLRKRAERGDLNIINRIAKAVAPAGYSLAFHGGSEGARANAATGDGPHLFHMQEPIGPRCLSLRRAYIYPFWHIEATNERWLFDVAEAKFDPALIDMDLARPFHNRWRNNLLGKEKERRDGYVFMPLQAEFCSTDRFSL